MKKQNVVLKVGIGVVLGMGALTFAPRAAQAATPCTPAVPADSSPCQNNDPNLHCTLKTPGEPVKAGCFYYTENCAVQGIFYKEEDTWSCTLTVNGVSHTGDCPQTTYYYAYQCWTV